VGLALAVVEAAVSTNAVDAEADELEGGFAVGMDLGEGAIERRFGDRHPLRHIS
jgi:hypothetical protein